MNNSPYYYNPGRCVVCRQPGTRRLPGDDPYCGQPVCSLSLRQSPNAQRCRICRCILRPAEKGRGICDEPQCVIRDGARAAEVQRKAQQRHVRQLIKEHVHTFAEQSGVSPDTVLNAVVPANDNQLLPIEETRKKRFISHLNNQLDGARRLLADNKAPALDDAEDGPELRRALSVCAACRGGCCMTGGEHGYITPETIARYVALSGQPLDTLVEHYIERLPNTSYTNSCIFHGSLGCGLDRAMRSDTCNKHLCAGLEGLKARLREREGEAIVVIGTQNQRHVRTVIIESTTSP